MFMTAVISESVGLGWWHHPDENDTRNFPGWYLYYAVITEVVLVAGFIGLESIDPFIGEKDLDRFMFGLSFVITHDLTLIKIYIFIVKNNDIQDIVRTLEIRLKQFYQNNDRNRKMVRLTRIFTGTFLVFGWLTIINTDAYGIVQDLRWKSEIAQVNYTATKQLRTLPQPMYIPWNYQSDITYIATFILETFGLLWTGHILITIDTFIAAIILHMSSQFATLQEALMTAYDRTFADLTENINRDSDGGLTIDDPPNSDLVSYQERLARAYRTEKDIENALENTMKNCIRQHQMLISCVEKFESIYSYGFMTQLLSSMAVICVVMVQVSKDSSSLISISLATSLAFFAAMVVQLAIQCFTGSELTHQASLVSDAVMQCKWERMPLRVRRMLLLTMRRAQEPLQLSAAGFVYLDNNCFVAIMKAAYSYYAVLSQKQI